MIAELSTQLDSDFVVKLLLALNFLGTLLLGLDKLRGRTEPRQISPTPLPVELVRELATKDELEALRLKQSSDVRLLFTEMRDLRTELLSAGDHRSAAITAHVEAVRKELDDQIKAMPLQLVTLLKQTGALK